MNLLQVLKKQKILSLFASSYFEYCPLLGIVGFPVQLCRLKILLSVSYRVISLGVQN